MNKFIKSIVVILLSLISTNTTNAYNQAEGSKLRALVARDGKIGYVNENGANVIPLIYDEGTNFYNGHACVRKKRNHYLIDRNGNVIQDITNLMSAKGDDRCYYYGSYYGSYNPLTGRVQILTKDSWNSSSLDFITWDSDGTVKKHQVRRPAGAKWSDYSILSTETVHYFDICRTNSSMSKGKDGDIKVCSTGVYDSNGNLLFKSKREDLRPFSNGYARITTFKKRSAAKLDTIYNVKYGFIDLYGKKIPNCNYDFALDFSDSLACVHKNGKAGYIDITGEIVLPFVFDGEKSRTVGKFFKDCSAPTWDINAHSHYSIGKFDNGLAIQRLNGAYVIIDKSGNVVSHLTEFKGKTMPIRYFNNGIIVFYDSAYNIAGYYIVPHKQYDYIGPFILISE